MWVKTVKAFVIGHARFWLDRIGRVVFCLSLSISEVASNLEGGVVFRTVDAVHGVREKTCIIHLLVGEAGGSPWCWNRGTHQPLEEGEALTSSAAFVLSIVTFGRFSKVGPSQPFYLDIGWMNFNILYLEAELKLSHTGVLTDHRRDGLVFIYRGRNWPTADLLISPLLNFDC